MYRHHNIDMTTPILCTDLYRLGSGVSSRLYRTIYGLERLREAWSPRAIVLDNIMPVLAECGVKAPIPQPRAEIVFRHFWTRSITRVDVLTLSLSPQASSSQDPYAFFVGTLRIYRSDYNVYEALASQG